MSPQIAIYTSDHGFGHAMRAVFLAEALIARGAHCHIVGDRPPHLFARLPDGAFTLHPRQVDAGLVQRDWLTLNIPATLEKHRRLFADPQRLIQREVAFLKEIGTDLVVSETPPVALEIAARAGVPGVINTNFDWHWLYSELSIQHPELAPLAQQAKTWYQRASLVLRLPLDVGMEQTFSAFTDVPLMVGRLRRRPEEIRRDLGLPEDAPALMWNFGGHAGDLPDFDRILADLPDWHLLSYVEHPTTSPRYCHVPPDFNTTELFSTLDALISKLGYCTCAEVCAFQIPFLFFVREGYPEDLALQGYMGKSAPGARLRPEDLPSGAWLDKFHAVVAQPRRHPLPADGADRAAELYLDLIGCA